MIDYLRLTLPTSPRPDIEQFQRPFVQNHILGAYSAAREKPSHATPILSRWFRARRSLGSKDRRRVSDAVYDLIRYGDFLNYAGLQSPEDLLEGWLAMQRGEQFSSLEETTPIHDMSIALGVPIWMMRDWHGQIGLNGCVELVRSMNERATVQIRCYPHTESRESLQKDLRDEGISATPIVMTSHGLNLNQRCNLQATKAFREGRVEVQDAASQMLCEAITPIIDEAILDYCAGAGGKSLFLASLGAKVFINEPRSNARKQAYSRAIRAKVNIIDELPTQVNTVLVDAPCSGTGRLRREPALRWRYPKQQDHFEWLPLQQRIIRDAACHVAPGGHLIYATCSMLSCENQPQIPNWTTVSTQRLWPHHHSSDGFSWTILRRPPNT